ncbi:MAG: hypothetical protein QOF19_885 [Alphaproteobacteria bacterium]|jgi:hypothetical protein|nr:hypothetical protein [Alphaproteobacteria bacterium]MEA2975365.1 hypothetical protein [Alphaproteobacteria bacterium]
MPDTLSPSSDHLSPSNKLIMAAAGLMLAATVALWGYYGTAVFYEMILAGVAACF